MKKQSFFTQNPGICALLFRFMQMPHFKNFPFWCKCGFWLLLLNIPFGYGGMFFCASLSVATKCAYWLKVGFAIYIFSWFMLGLGVFLAGPESARKMTKLTKRRYRAWKRLRESRVGA
ncbi:MAG: hypothetical protein WCS73_04470 [Lentisphaeria bacterium]